MKRLATLLIVAAVALSACTNANRFGKGGDAAGGPNGIDQAALGDPSNPASPAYFKASIGDTVHFMVDQHILSPEAQGILGGQAQWLQTNPQYAVLIEGHADEQGTTAYNIALGDRRANAVREFLISRGIAANRIQTISYGKSRPIALCSEEACFAQNRRAVTVVTVGAHS